ncbi:prohibitin family protein [Candidatus Saccharibacteria bacterium]|nr:prohibitin family protein [Candidatus Saccharibacteria bacterium]
MVWFILAIVAVVITVIIAICLEDYRLRTCLIGGGVAIVLFVISCIGIVPTGFTGILTTFGRVEDRTISAGFNFIAPWQSVVTMDNRTQKASIEVLAFSSDTQEVKLQLSVNYSINEQAARDLYGTVGTNYYNTVMLPRITEHTKGVISKYSAETLVANRDVLSTQIFGKVVKEIGVYKITLVSVSLEDIDFTDAYTNAVEEKQVNTQKKLSEEIKQAQLTMEAKEQKERTVIQAQADAEKAKISAAADLEVQKLKADAELYARQKEAEGNLAVAQSLSSELIDYYRINKWDGKLPTTTLGESSGFMISLGSTEKSPE